jgi:putative Mg2+ transporter-C (MgtC) family protein
VSTEVLDIAIQLVAAGFLGACIGFERRIHHKAIGIAGMVLIAIGSTTYLARTLQGFLSGIGFLSGAVIFKRGFDVKGIKAAAAIWITGALGLAIATSYWWLGIRVGLVTAAVMFVANSFPDEVREEKQKTPNAASDAKKYVARSAPNHASSTLRAGRGLRRYVGMTAGASPRHARKRAFSHLQSGAERRTAFERASLAWERRRWAQSGPHPQLGVQQPLC